MKVAVHVIFYALIFYLKDISLLKYASAANS